MLPHAKLPHEYDPEFYEILRGRDWDVTLMRNRKYMQEKYAYTLPTQEALDTIVKYKDKEGFLEVAAGRGYWASLLQAMGNNVIATDNLTEFTKYFSNNDRYTTVLDLDALEATEQYPHHTLIIMYPPNESTWPIDVIGKYQGEYIILVAGDGCATDDLWGIFDAAWDQVEYISLTHWPLFPSDMYVYRRKPTLDVETEILTNIHNRVLRLELHTNGHALT